MSEARGGGAGPTPVAAFRSCTGVHRRLPAFDIPARLGGASRRSRHRHGLRAEELRRKNETLDALHWCLGARTSACAGASEFEVEAVAALVAPVVAKPAAAPSQEEAARVLLRGHLSYDAEETHTTVVPYEFGSVSLPEHVHDAADVAGVLGAEDRLIIEGWQKSMMRSTDEFEQLNERLGDIKPFWDKKLSRNKKAYRQFILDLDRRGMIKWTTDPIEHAGLFFVGKKDKSLRLIIDARRGNRRFKAPPITPT